MASRLNRTFASEIRRGTFLAHSDLKHIRSLVFVSVMIDVFLGERGVFGIPG